MTQPPIADAYIRRFWGRVIIFDGNHCWEWNGAKSNGYGSFRINGKSHYAHRVSWLINNGRIPEGFFVCHKCDNRSCVNPKHLFLGTAKDNVSDCVNKDRHARGERNGHAKLTAYLVQKIRQACLSGYSQREIARRLSLSNGTVSMAASGKRWGHLK